MENKGDFFIGTSGWQYDHWKGPFYPEEMQSREMLEYYCGKFSTVEINNSFYQLPSAKTVDFWQSSVPGGFLFSIKASRYITHMKKLKDPAESVQKFFSVVEGFKNHLGPVLFQLPPKWRYNHTRLKNFLEMLPDKYRYVFEFRDKSWICDQALELLQEHRAAFCIYELAGYQTAKEVTADFIYIRLHGPGDAYEGKYDTSELSGWAGACSGWLRQGNDVYCYFDNDQNGYAPLNAQELQHMLQTG